MFLIMRPCVLSWTWTPRHKYAAVSVTRVYRKARGIDYRTYS